VAVVTTQQKQVRWTWVLFIAMPIFANALVEASHGSALPFTARKFTSSATVITFLSSLNVLFLFVVSPFVAWKSDRIWTRFGRRKPFLIAGWSGLAISLLFVPLMPNLWLLGLSVLLYTFFLDMSFGGTYNVLTNEVVPPHQRGRLCAMMMIIANCGWLLFSSTLIKQYEREYQVAVGGQFLLQFRGEHVIFWTASLGIVVVMLLVGRFLRETPVMPPAVTQSFSFRCFFRDTFGQRQYLMIYLLVLVQVAMNAGMAALGPLMIREQFGYSMTALGNIASVTIVVKIVVLSIAGYFADRANRLNMLAFSMSLSTLHPLLYWLFIHFASPGGVPPVGAIIGFDIFGMVVDVTGGVAMAPLFFDFIPRNRMGTVFAGTIFVRGFVRLIIINALGMSVDLYSWMFSLTRRDYSFGLLYVTAINVIGLFGI